MNVLSLFDGMSCGRIALERAGININEYHSCEIKKSAIKCSNYNYPEIIRHGSVIGYVPDYKVDLLIGGSPCQDFSIAKATSGKVFDYGLNGEKSKLFYEYLRILEILKSKNSNIKFLLENVKMKKESKMQLDKYIGVEGIEICSSKFSFQKRKRYYWTNISFDKNIIDRQISFQDYIGIGNIEESIVNKTLSREKMWNNGNGRTNIKACDNITKSMKIGCLMRKQDRAPNSGLISHGSFCRYLTRRELEAAQTVPYGYTDVVSYNQAQDLLGDGWTVDVIAHIFKGLK